MKPKLKWSYAIGTTSRVPNSKELHYLIADFDGPIPLHFNNLLCHLPHVFIQPTKHGWHVYTSFRSDFKSIIELLSYYEADPNWIKIGRQRGYLFLADKDVLRFPYPVERMQIYWRDRRNGKKKKHYSGRH